MNSTVLCIKGKTRVKNKTQTLRRLEFLPGNLVEKCRSRIPSLNTRQILMKIFRLTTVDNTVDNTVD
jgi:hypothetical protein